MTEFSHEETVSWLDEQEKRMSSASIVLYDAAGHVLVVKAHNKPYWSFPGGVIDKGETPMQAAIRETEEEVGLTVSEDSLRFCMVVDRVSRIAQTYQFIFDKQVEESTFEQVSLDDHEMEDYAIVSREEIISCNRYYSQTTVNWAKNFNGYVEMEFGARPQIDE